MNDKILKLVGPLALVAAAGGAHAATIPFNTNNNVGQNGSDLVLFVSDTTDGEYFTYDTGVSLDSILTQAAISAGGVQTTAIGTISTPTFSSAVQAALTNFLNNDTSVGDSVTWTIAAGDSNSIGHGGYVGANRYLVTGTQALDGTTNVTRLSNTLVKTAVGSSASTGLEGFFNEVNAAGIPASGISTSEGWGKGTLGQNQLNGNSAFGSQPVTAIPLVSGTDSTSQLYLFATNSTQSQPANVYDTTTALDLSWTFGGNATLAPVAAVPLPAAVWLFGSGLLGLFGIGRRKLSAAA